MLLKFPNPFKVIPQKKKKESNIFFKLSLNVPYQGLFRKIELKKKDGSPCLFRRYNRQNLHHLSLYWH